LSTLAKKTCQKVAAEQNNHQNDSFVGPIDNYVFALSKAFRCRPLFQTKVGKFGVTIEIKFIDVVTAFMNKKI